MTSNGRHETARIYQFPVKPRRISETARSASPSVNGQIRPVPAAEFGSGWYHDAAIETEQARPYAG